MRIVAAVLCGVLAGAPWAAAQSESKPNVLFCIADDASWLHFGAYGCRWVKTPNFDRVAKAGVLFENAYTPTAKCAPSRAALLTGRYPWQLEEAANHMCYFPAKFKSFAEALEASGYYVGLTGKGWGPGIVQTADGQARELLVRKYPPRRPRDFASAFKTFLAERPKERPFFFWFGSTDPHRPYAAGSGLQSGKKLTDVDRVPGFWPDNATVRGDMLDYGARVEEFDRQLGEVLKVLEDQPFKDQTLVCVTSDNGMPFPRGKGHTYELSNHMPLAVSWPSGIKNPGRKSRQPVSFVDLAPTFLDLGRVDAQAAGMAEISGKSLTDVFWDAPAKERPFVLLGRERNDWGRPNLGSYPVRGLLRNQLLLLVNLAPERWPCCDPESDYPDTDPGPTKSLIALGRGKPELSQYWEWSFGKRPPEELYDLAADPDCLRNLAADPGYQFLKEELRQVLFLQLKHQKDPRVGGMGDVFDKYLPTRKDWIGKYEREIAPMK